jgi:arylsulfatase A-like enzyme
LRPVLMEMDREIGRLLASLRRDGLASNALVIFLADNGPLPPFQQERTSGLRGSKLSLYEGGIREPLIAWWPATCWPVASIPTVSSGHRFSPDAFQTGGAKVPEEFSFDGEDFSAAMLGQNRVRANRFSGNTGATRTSFGYPGIAHNRSPNVAMREGQWKLLVNADGSGAELLRCPQRSKRNAQYRHRTIRRREPVEQRPHCSGAKSLP